MTSINEKNETDSNWVKDYVVPLGTVGAGFIESSKWGKQDAPTQISPQIPWTPILIGGAVIGGLLFIPNLLKSKRR